MKRVFNLIAPLCGLVLLTPVHVQASGGGETIKVSKCFYQSGSGQGLIKASSSNSTAHLFAYLPTGEYYGEVQNGGGSRYGGTVMRYLQIDPVFVIINSSTGASITVPTTPFQL